MDEDAGKRFLCDRGGYKLVAFHFMLPWHACRAYLEREEGKKSRDDGDSRREEILMEDGKPIKTKFGEHKAGCVCSKTTSKGGHHQKMEECTKQRTTDSNVLWILVPG